MSNLESKNIIKIENVSKINSFYVWINKIIKTIKQDLENASIYYFYYLKLPC